MSVKKYQRQTLHIISEVLGKKGLDILTKYLNSQEDALYYTFTNLIDAVNKRLSGSDVWNPASLAAGATATKTVTVTGAVSGDTVLVGFTSITTAGWQISGQVTAADTVTVTLTNQTGGTVDLPSGTVNVDVWRR